MRINHNIAAMNAQRSLIKVNEETTKSLEHLSSGMKINIGADGPANLVISENMRAQISGLNQAVENSEQSITMIQTAEGALNEVNRLLVDIRQLAIHASNDGINDPRMLDADQAEIENALETIDRIATNTQFGRKLLLDGSRGANGVATGEGLEFVQASDSTKGSPVEGYDINISRVATKSRHEGSIALTQEMLDAGETFTLMEGGKTLSFKSLKGESIESNVNALKNEVKRSGLDLNIDIDESGILSVQSNEYGSDQSFRVASSTAGVLSIAANESVESARGLDVQGTINGEEARGLGQVLTAKEGTSVAGLKVRYTKDTANGEGESAGTVSVFQNSLNFQVGANVGQTSQMSIRSMKINRLGTGLANESNYRSIKDVDVRSFQGAQDALALLDKAIDETTTERAKLGAFQKNNLQANLNNLRVSQENLTSAESTIRDADMAYEMANFTRNQIITQSSTAMLAQANQRSQSVLGLLG